MAASVKLVLRQDKTRADGTAPVYIRITANRKSRFLATGVAVDPRDWNERRQEVRASHELAKALNRRLQDQYNDARLAALDAPTATAAKVAIAGPSGSLSAYFDRHITRLEAAGKHSQLVHFAVTRDYLRAALGAELSFGEVD